MFQEHAKQPTEEAVTSDSADSASVNTSNGPNALLMDSRTSKSCHVNFKCLVLLSDCSIWRIASFCSKIVSIMSCVDPHRVEQSDLRECKGRFSDCCTSVKSRFFFQLKENTLTILRHKPRARLTLPSSLIEFVTAKWRLWPKHSSHGHAKVLFKAQVMFALLSHLKNNMINIYINYINVV